MINFKSIILKDFIKPYSPPSPSQEVMENFSQTIQDFLQRAFMQSDEEFQKNEINRFLAKTYGYDCNTLGKVDSAIYVDREAQVLIEVKAFENKAEFPKDSPLSKAFYESILYFLRETQIVNNNSIKHVILCNPYEFYLFDAKSFNIFSKDKKIQKFYKNCDGKEGTNTKTEKFYADLENYLKDEFEGELPYTYFSFQNNLSIQELTIIYQLLSPQVLLKARKTIDANTLNKNFYDELLYILGLQEVVENGKILIKPSSIPNTLSHAISQVYQNIDEESIFTLITTWNNRILFLRLLESMLLGFKHIDKPFLDFSTIRDFKTLQILFFEVLAKKQDSRSPSLPKDFLSIPYLNSSLFDKTSLEYQGKEIGMLDSLSLTLFSHSILRKDPRFKNKETLPLLEYLFEFLHAYDFTTTPKDISDGIKQNHDLLINSAVLGLVFEKLNGYKEGSFYTPSFITSFMCKESITQAVLEKFNSIYSWKCKNLKELREEMGFKGFLEYREEYFKTLLSITICDPAVGSGHFLVSALNEMIKIAYTLRLIPSLYESTLELENDEIQIKTQDKLHQYIKPTSMEQLSHQIQKEMFDLKKSIIENCLFGVDINPNSCEITKLRLWIELLKYSYYLFDENGKNTNALETLPNIDINIKCGNSLISYFDLKQSLTHYPNIKPRIQNYKNMVKNYKEGFFSDKTKLNSQIKELLTAFQKFCFKDKYKKEMQTFQKQCDKYRELYGNYLAKDDDELVLYISENPFPKYEHINEAQEEIHKQACKDFSNLKQAYNTLYNLSSNNPFEWRFEFPEVLDEEGNFKGFDCVIGNPPYIKEGGNKELFALTKHLRTYQGKMDIWYHFAGKALELLKPKGELGFIATNNWTTNAGAEKLRNILLEETRFISLIDFGSYMVFDSASIQTMIMRFKKENPPKEYCFDYRKIIAEKPTESNRIALLEKKEFEDNFYFNAKIDKEKLVGKLLNFSSFDSIFEQVLENDVLFLREQEISQGIVYPQENINKNSFVKLGKKFQIGQGIQKLSNKEKDTLKLSKEELELLKPIYETSEVMKYFTIPQNQYWVIYTDSKFKKLNSMDKYPELKRHLDRFKEVITSDNRPYGLHRARDEKFFIGSPRIIALRKCAKEPIFSYVDFDCYVSATFNIIKTERFNAKFLTGLLNSSLVKFWLKHKGKMQGNNYQIDKEPLMNIPLIKITKSNQSIADEIIALVEKILKAKEQNPKANTQELEKEIDSLVYTLYTLTPEEIAIIEGKE
ncbi:Eco57I restriction-modification methylase domain-containing protein [Helicobacter anatolicus]|uniref:type IIG restriction enzyme/methyltransferase n=1 Tax=Helicobacter anatolicus TaxID=2905874 RepID=UPI001E38C339|nr:Eco57I restriction-modification methylase domain-containing protein [Helicobacter anatolicus]MCE3039731.1 Eco57I restriction-modification methylase domain-containing protein [Helicobacter anatolicus]